MLVTSFQPLPMGGSERQALALAIELTKLGISVRIAAIGRNKDPEYEKIEGVEVHRFKSIFYRRFLSGLKRIGRQSIKPIKIEYDKNDKENALIKGKKSMLSFIPYFTFLIQVFFFFRKGRGKQNFVYTPIMEWTAFIGTLLGKLLGAKSIIKDSTMNGIVNLLRYPFGKYMQKVIVDSSYFVAMTKAIRDNYVMAGISENRIFCIPNGVYRSTETNYNPINGKFIFVGNLYQQPAKGIDVLMKAWIKVIESCPECMLFVIGDGCLTQYEEYSTKLGISRNIIFLGKQFDVKNHLRESVAFILPSRREGMSNALLEAMSFGLPCIATNISGSQDLIKHNYNGLLVPVEEKDAIAEAVLYLHRNPELAGNMGREAKRTIDNGFTMEHIAAKYQRMIIRLLDARGVEE